MSSNCWVCSVGFLCAVFAYGATGAGKTFSMLGSPTSPGVIFLTMMDLYQRIDGLKEDKTCDVAVSYLEVSFFSCDQAALWMVQSVCLSVTPFSPCFHHHTCIVMKFSGVIITIDRSDVHAKGQGQWSQSQVKTSFSRFRTVTPVWIHIWGWNDAQSLMWHRKGALLFFKVTPQIFKVTWDKKIVDFHLNLAFPD